MTEINETLFKICLKKGHKWILKGLEPSLRKNGTSFDLLEVSITSKSYRECDRCHTIDKNI